MWWEKGEGKSLNLSFFVFFNGIVGTDSTKMYSLNQQLSTNQNDDVMSLWSVCNKAPDEGKGQLVNVRSSLVSK